MIATQQIRNITIAFIMRGSINLGTSDDIFFDILDCLKIVKNINIYQLSFVY